MIGSYSEFCKYMGIKSKSYVNKLKKQGRLVFDGDKIDFEKSKAKICATNDIARESVADRQPIPTPADTAEINTGTGGSNKQAKEQYDLARTMKEAYSAKYKKLEFEKLLGKLGSLEDIQRYGYEIGKIFKTRLATFAIRAAPVVTKEMSEKANREYLLGEMDRILQDVTDEIERIRNTGD